MTDAHDTSVKALPPEVFNALLEVISVAEYAASRRAMLVCLILTYTAIDAVSWLASDSDAVPVGARFRAWVARYLLPEAPELTCTTEELYAARCGILHTLTGESREHQRGGLRQLGYAWGSAAPESVNDQVSGSALSERLVTVRVEDLTKGLRHGTARFLEDAAQNPATWGRILDRAERFYTYLPRRP